MTFVLMFPRTYHHLFNAQPAALVAFRELPFGEVELAVAEIL
jgi:hypothetical protein